MPTYSYRCTDCGTAFDIQQAFTDDSLTECPNCGGPLRKLYGSVGVTFNGPGFYRTDSRASVGDGSGGKKESSGSSESAPKPAAAPAPAAPSSGSSSGSSSSSSTSST